MAITPDDQSGDKPALVKGFSAAYYPACVLCDRTMSREIQVLCNACFDKHRTAVELFYFGPKIGYAGLTIKEFVGKIIGEALNMPVQRKLTLLQVQEIIANIKFMDRNFRVETMGEGCFLQVQYMEDDIETGKMELQLARKWYVSFYSTETEIVETAFKACRVSMDHVLKEHFTYQGRRVYSPHFSVQARMAMCDDDAFDGRIPISLVSK